MAQVAKGGEANRWLAQRGNRHRRAEAQGRHAVRAVGDGQGGAVPAFRDMVYGMKIEGSGTAARLWLTVAGEACGRKPAPDFASESFCDRPIAWNAAGRKFAYAPVSTVRMIQ